MNKKKNNDFKFGVNACSLCEQMKLTVGQQKWGGIRYCQDCIKQTLDWFQLQDDQKQGLMKLFDTLMLNDTVKQKVKDAEAMGEKDLKNISIGEARFRWIDSLKYG